MTFVLRVSLCVLSPLHQCGNGNGVFARSHYYNEEIWTQTQWGSSALLLFPCVPAPLQGHTDGVGGLPRGDTNKRGAVTNAGWSKWMVRLTFFANLSHFSAASVPWWLWWRSKCQRCSRVVTLNDLWHLLLIILLLSSYIHLDSWLHLHCKHVHYNCNVIIFLASCFSAVFYF